MTRLSHHARCGFAGFLGVVLTWGLSAYGQEAAAPMAPVVADPNGELMIRALSTLGLPGAVGALAWVLRGMLAQLLAQGVTVRIHPDDLRELRESRKDG